MVYYYSCWHPVRVDKYQKRPQNENIVSSSGNVKWWVLDQRSLDRFSFGSLRRNLRIVAAKDKKLVDWNEGKPNNSRSRIRLGNIPGAPTIITMDEGLDPCEYVWSNLAVQRLLSILRQTQLACTENECYPTTRLPGPQNDQPSTDMFFLTMIFGVLALLYAFRPNSLRRTSLENKKAFDNAPGSNDDPPAPPPAAN